MVYRISAMAQDISRRSLLAAPLAALPLALPLPAAKKKVPVGLELFSVRQELSKDLFGTVKAVAKMGYEGVEFYSPYFQWTTAYAKDVRKLLDDLNIRCFSTHNGAASFQAVNHQKAIELNQILGSKFIIMASAGKQAPTEDAWKKVAESLSTSAEAFGKQGIKAGFHNHQLEFRPLDGGGPRPIEVIAKNTPKNVVLQLDVGTAVEVGYDPIAWINQNAGRINILHLKEWGPKEGYQSLLGEGVAPWKKIFQAAEKKGAVEYYLVEQEGSRFTPMETAEKCLAAFRQMRK
jgi:sugar phosphate isomerase/epimerase